MKARSACLYLLMATLFATPGFAQSEPEAAKPDGSGAKEKRRQEMLRRYDKNGDSKLDDEEKAAMKADKISQGNLWNPGDNNAGPGAAGEGRMKAELLKRFDKNGDGKLDDAERAEMEKARQQMQQNGGSARFRAKIIKMFDQDGDGVLNEAERAAAEKFRAEQIRRFDQDGDGRLNAEERAEALKAFVAEHPDMAPRVK